MRTLRFKCRGEWFKVSPMGFLTQEQNKSFSGAWKFLGTSKHHWSNHIDVPFAPNGEAKSFINGLVWDIDHGTIRTWGGQYQGKLPRITEAYWQE